MLDKKELNVMELDNVSGGNWLNEVGDFFEDAAEEVWDATKSVSEAVAKTLAQIL